MRTRLSMFFPTFATMANWRSLFLSILAVCAQSRVAPAAETQPALHKTGSTFYPPALLARVRANIARYPWAAAMQKQIVDAARPWMAMSDDELWSLMFGNTIKRSWMVWSSGYCPACRKPVPMYNWDIHALEHPWKVRCPHCKQYFPTNDFVAFYRSGLDEHGIFDPKRADRSLLFNTEHPDANDPLHLFGVDDGDGFSDGRHTWRFIGAYLIYGQWKQAVVAGIEALSAAYVVTGAPAYAHKAGILLDRVADLYPTFDFIKQGILYDAPSPAAGYVSVWHDACEETRQLVLGYDKVFEAIRTDQTLPAFLSRKAEQFKLGVPKATFADIQRNIEDRILRDPLAQRPKITSNYPRTEVAAAIIETVLGGPDARQRADAILDAMLTRGTAVDGVTGEKGLAGYTSYTIQGVAVLLEQYARLDPGFLKNLLKRHPKVHDMYRFHIDTWCFEKYYPLSGDTGSFAAPVLQYVGVGLSRQPGVDPSMFSFLWRLYQATGDAGFVQVLYHANGDTTDGLPYDLFAEDPAAIQKGVRDVIAREGPAPRLASVNKSHWHIGILRSGRDADARAAWLDYDAGGGHSHADGMNLGLFAKGLDLLPDFGYPPVNYGGWGSPRAVWYTMTAAHNTVVVDGRNQQRVDGQCTLWAQGNQFHAIRASGPALIDGKQYERTIAMIDASDHDSYILDVFRVVGGTDHAKFTHSHFGRIATAGVTLGPCDDFGHDTQMRNFRRDPSPKPGWSVDWTIDDRRHLLPAGADVHLRYTDLTTGAEADICEGWILAGLFNTAQDAWIPRVMVRRQSKQAPLASTFVSVMEPYEHASNIAAIRRLPLETESGETYPDSNVAVEVRFVDGRRDLVVATDIENPLSLTPSAKGALAIVRGIPLNPPSSNGEGTAPAFDKGGSVRTDAELSLTRYDAHGRVARIILCRGTHLRADDTHVRLKKSADVVEIDFAGHKPTVLAGEPQLIDTITADGRPVVP
jgi:hypothetical protein